MSGSSPLPDREERLDEAVAAYLEAVESGQKPDRAVWLARFPDLAAELGEFIDDQEKLQRWTSPFGNLPGEIASGEDTLATPPRPHATFSRSSNQLSNYELLDEIARGGMGVVYRARQLNLNRIVALKMILAGPHASPAELYRFRMETEAAASLDHPHIMPIYEVGDEEGRPFFSMKLMEGGTLAEHLSRYTGKGRAVAELMIKVARAVHHAHQRGILHRDLKPANILLDTHGEPFVTDFGLCRRVELDSGMTQSGVIVGTPSYMSPEQAAGRKELTTATDVYSLGAILYALLTDRPPFRGDTPLETVRGVLELEPSRPRLLQPQVDRDLETICLKCLDKRPEGRYGSAEALAEDLQRWLSGEPIVARRSSLWERTWKRTRRNPVAAALVAVSGLALVLLIAAVVTVQHHRLTMAEASLARVSRITKLRDDASGHIHEGDALLRIGDAQSAKLHANLASEQARHDAELLDLDTQAQALLARAQQQIAQDKLRADATESLRRFQAQRDDVLFYGSQFASELPANLHVAEAAGAAALKEIGLASDGTGALHFNPRLTGNERRTLESDCYELLLVLAEVSARQEPTDSVRATRLTKRAHELRSSLPATTALDHVLLGYEARKQGNLPVAIDEFRQAIRLQPRHTWARYFLAACCLATSPREAEGQLTALLYERPDLFSAYLLRGIAHVNLGEYEDAESDFEQALARAPINPQSTDFRYATLAIRGSFRTLRREFQGAEQDLLEAVRLKPESHLAYLHLAQTYERQGRTEAAERNLQHALASKDLTPQTEAGILLYRASRITSDSAAARVDIDRSLQLFPFAEAWRFRVDERRLCSPITAADLEDVVKYCDAALSSPAYSPETYNVGETHYLRAKAQVDLGRYEDAAQSLARFLAAGGKPSTEIHRLLGLIQVKHSDYPSAIHEFRQALTLNPGDPSTLAERGSIYLAIGALGLADDDFRAALVRDADNANALAGRGMIRATRADGAAAEEDAERAWRAGPPTQRLAWMTARTFAIAYGHLDARGPFVSVEEGRSKLRYRQRAVELLEQALLLTPSDQQATFWQEAVQADVWVRLLNADPRFRELQKKFAATAAAARPEL